MVAIPRPLEEGLYEDGKHEWAGLVRWCLEGCWWMGGGILGWTYWIEWAFQAVQSSTVKTILALRRRNELGERTDR